MVYVDYFFDTAPDFEPSRGLFYAQMLKYQQMLKIIVEIFCYSTKVYYLCVVLRNKLYGKKKIKGTQGK